MFFLKYQHNIWDINFSFPFSGLKIEDGEIIEEGSEAATDTEKKDSAIEAGEIVNVSAVQDGKKPSNWSRREGDQRPSKLVKEISFGLEFSN